ncbi:hypothetical protein NLJ89_g3653 [Agrocybe chaxingu]|uniref:Uncharacterized protein n=1 Tax=Agrocybe chaxingu TaxID=84603 RepID=A0A9W8MX71_9AGAR|nr:hypothetical protein NLJ89_g3653 [Agrocybe chaxingu]
MITPLKNKEHRNMSDLRRSDTVTKAIAAAQEEAATVPLREDDNDDETIRDVPIDTKINIDTSIFDVFTDFELDLSCLSAPPSPVASTSNLPPTTPSPPASPVLSRSMSFASNRLPALTASKSIKKASSPQLSATVPTGGRGSWPLIKYAGRGTPIDRNRRLEWGGFPAEEAAEDGVLFSHVRSTSLDSTFHPSRRSISPEWSHVPSKSSSLSHSHSMRSFSTSAIHEPPPELAPLKIDGVKSEDWDSLMKTVLASTSEPSTSSAPVPITEDLELECPSTVTEPEAKPAVPPVDLSMISPEQLEQLNAGLDMDLGLNAALDLGLGQRGGMNWFDLGLLPTSAASGRESPSVYSSQAVTPRPSPPASVHASEHRSTTSTKADMNGNSNGTSVIKSTPRPWWQKLMLSLRRVRTVITIHKHR